MLVIFSSNCIGANDPLIVRYNHPVYYPNESEQIYYSTLLEMALEETVSDFGPYKLQRVNIDMLQQRGLSMLEDNKIIDVFWTMTSPAREKAVLPVYFPLLKGLMGHRVFLINKGEQSRFDNVAQLTDLKKFVAGQGIHWPDTDVLKYNQLPVIEAIGSLLHEMLLKRRFDYFPRAVTEVQKELEAFDNLEVEDHLLLQYFAPVFFFVNKQNTKLSTRLTVGLHRLQQKGDFDRYFSQATHIQQMLKSLNIKGRQRILLDNPYVTDRTKALRANKSLWLIH